jgi:hypothetical protein
MKWKQFLFIGFIGFIGLFVFGNYPSVVWGQAEYTPATTESASGMSTMKIKLSDGTKANLQDSLYRDSTNSLYIKDGPSYVKLDHTNDVGGGNRGSTVYKIPERFEAKHLFGLGERAILADTKDGRVGLIRLFGLDNNSMFGINMKREEIANLVYTETNATNAARNDPNDNPIAKKISERTGADGAPKGYTGPVDVTCKPWDIYCLVGKIMYHVVLGSAAVFTGISGSLFDYSIEQTINLMGKHYKQLEEPISMGWTIFRDLINIMFLFVLLYYGILTIIHGYSANSKQIITVIVIALIINFSMLLTKVVIDISNILALEFRSAVTINVSSSGTGSMEEQATVGLAAPYVQNLGLGSIFKAADDLQGDWPKLIIVSAGGTIVLLTLSIILLLVSLMFIVRFIVLIILLITSSAAVGSWILPQLQAKIWKPWISALIGQSFFAPVFLLFFLISMMVLKGVNSMLDIDKTGWAEGFTGNTAGAGALLLGYLITLGFLIGSLIVSKQLSNQAGSYVQAANNWIGQRVGGITLGAAGLAGRTTVGRTAQNISENWKPTGAFGKFFKEKTFDKVAKSSFDLRNAKIAQGLGVAKTLGDGSGQGGFKKVREDQVKGMADWHEDAGKLTEREKIEKAKLEEEKELNTKAKDLELKKQALETEKGDLQRKYPYDNAKRIAEKKRIEDELAENKAEQDKLKKPKLSEAEAEARLKQIKDKAEGRQTAVLKSIDSGILSLRKSNEIASAKIRASNQKKKEYDKLPLEKRVIVDLVDGFKKMQEKPDSSSTPKPKP